MKDRLTAIVAWTGLVLMVVLSWCYHRYWLPVSMGDMDPDDFSRGIGTPLLLWMNGYLGVFLNLRSLGPAVGLALPLIGLGLFRWRALPVWQRGLLVFTLLAVAVIGGFGGFNYRYALTLQPLLTIVVLATAWKLLRGCSRAWFIAALTLLALINTALSLEHRRRTSHAEPGWSSPDTKRGTLKERLDQGPRDLEKWLNENGVRSTDTVLVNNLPIWYYVTDRPGIYYWCGSDQLFLSEGKPFLFKERSADEVGAYLRDSLHCCYVFSSAEYNQYAPLFQDFLHTHTELLAEDDKGHTLHRLKDTFGR